MLIIFPTFAEMSHVNKITLEQKKAVLRKVSESKTFSKSSNNLALLRFLGNSAIANETVKESIIGMELFGKNFDVEKSNARVRVNVYNLRKKLERYYEDEGANDALILSIPKGQYNLSFKTKDKPKRKALNLKPFLYLSCGTSVILLILLAISTFTATENHHIPYWQPFFENGKSTTVFVGDVFSFRGETEFGKINVIRDFRINNSQEFYDYLEAHPEISADFKPNHFTYLTYMGPASVNKFSQLFAQQNLSLDVKLSSSTDFQDIKTNNCVYVGPLNNKNRFVSLFNYQSDVVKIQDHQILILDSLEKVTKSYYGKDSDLSTDYALVSRIPGPNNTEQFLFFSVHDIGVVGVLNYFTQTDSLKSIQDQLPTNSPYFTAIFKVSGMERTSLNTELLFLKNIKGRYN